MLLLGAGTEKLTLTTIGPGVLDPGINLSGGGAHWALKHWYVTFRPITEPNGPKIVQFGTQNHHSNSKNVLKIYVLNLRGFL